MRIRWRGLELPTRLVRDDAASTPTYGRFIVEPFERGFGTTVGNSLRRILLSSLEGAAVTHVRIKGADHEFSTLPGVMEDVTAIILNVKSLIVRLTSETPKTMRLAVRGKAKSMAPVTAAQLECDPAIEIINKEQLLCTLTDDVEFEMDLTAGLGRSYVTAAEHKAEGEDQVIGVIPVDSVYSPVIRVRYRVEDTRVGQRTNYDRLVLEVWTNGTLSPEMAVVEAAKILRKHLNPFVQYFELGSGLALEGSIEQPGVAGQKPDEAKLAMTIADLDLSVRSRNCLASANIQTVRQLVQMDEAELLKLRSFGKTSLREVKRKLADHGLALRVDPGAPAIDLSGDDDEPVERPTESVGVSRPPTYSGAALDSGSMGPLPPYVPPQSDAADVKQRVDQP
jgi:DNA-directed RNA polymerase subunit alpha